MSENCKCENNAIVEALAKTESRFVFATLFLVIISLLLAGDKLDMQTFMTLVGLDGMLFVLLHRNDN